MPAHGSPAIYVQDEHLTVWKGDALTVLQALPSESVQCCVTSPPYWRLRDYGVAGQIGLEGTIDEFLKNIIAVFQEVRRVLRADGTCWVNMGDTYASGGKGGGGVFMEQRREKSWQKHSKTNGWHSAPEGLKDKDLIGMPWRVPSPCRRMAGTCGATSSGTKRIRCRRALPTARRKRTNTFSC